MITTCPYCNGEGYIRIEKIVGEVSHEMAMDACDLSYEGQPIYDWVDSVCEVCGGSGTVEEPEARK